MTYAARQEAKTSQAWAIARTEEYVLSPGAEKDLLESTATAPNGEISESDPAPPSLPGSIAEPRV